MEWRTFHWICDCVMNENVVFNRSVVHRNTKSLVEYVIPICSSNNNSNEGMKQNHTAKLVAAACRDKIYMGCKHEQQAHIAAQCT